MHKRRRIVWLMTCALALYGCAASGPAARPAVCPKLPPAPPSLMQPSSAEAKVRAELFEPLPSATPRSPDSNN